MSEEDYKISYWSETSMTGGKRTNTRQSDNLGDWFVGYGKDRSCIFEGDWYALVTLALKILSSPNTEKLVEEVDEIPEEVFQEDLREIAEQLYTYTGKPYIYEDN